MPFVALMVSVVMILSSPPVQLQRAMGSMGSSDIAAAPASISLVDDSSRNENQEFFDLQMGCQVCSEEEDGKDAGVSCEKFIRGLHHKRMRKKIDESHMHNCHGVERETV
jgi:hypothetical protein